MNATNLNNIGSVYSSLGQPQKALEYYNTSLPIHKEVGNLFGEANTLSNIGSVYKNSKRPKEAIAINSDKHSRNSIILSISSAVGLVLRQR